MKQALPIGQGQIGLAAKRPIPREVSSPTTTTTTTAYYDAAGNEITKEQFESSQQQPAQEIQQQNVKTTDEFMEEESGGYKDSYSQIYISPRDRAFEQAKKTEEFIKEEGWFGTGFKTPLDPIVRKTVYGWEHLTGSLIGTAAAGTKRAVYDITKSPEIARGAGTAASIPVAVVPYLLSGPVSYAASVATTLGSKSKEEAIINVGTGTLFGAAGKAASKVSGALKALPVVEASAKASKAVNILEAGAKYGPTLYYGGQTVMSGVQAIGASAAGDRESASEYISSLQKSLAGGVIGRPIGSAAVDIATTVPKTAILGGQLLRKGRLFNETSAGRSEYGFSSKGYTDVSKADSTMAKIVRRENPFLNQEGFEILKAAPSTPYSFLLSPKKIAGTIRYGTPKQLEAIAKGEAIPLPQQKGVGELLKSATKSKAAKSAYEDFPELFKEGDPVLFRTGGYKLPAKPKAYMSEEAIVYTSPGAISSIGLPSLKSQGQSSVTKLGIFDSAPSGRIQLTNPESIGRFPTSKTFANIRPQDVAALRRIGGVDLSKAGAPKFEVPGKVTLGKSFVQQEGIKVAIMKGRPIKGKFIGKSLTGKDVTGLEPELQNLLIEPQLTPGRAYPSIAYTLGKGGEAEIGLPFSQRSIITPAKVSNLPKWKESLGVPEAYATFGGKAFRVEGYRFAADPAVVYTPSKETKQLVKYEKIKSNLTKTEPIDLLSRGEDVRTVSIFSKAPIVNVSSLSSQLSTPASFVSGASVVSGVSAMSSTTSSTTSSSSSPSRSVSSVSSGSSLSSGFSGMPSGSSVPGILSGPSSQSQPQRLVQRLPSYDVYVRKGTGPSGKDRKINEVLVASRLPYGTAVNKGLKTVDTYSQRTAIIRPSKYSARSPDELVNKELLSKFRPLRPKTKIKKGKIDEIFVEKAKYAIDSYQEKQGIPYKAARLSKERKMSFGKFGGMRV